MTGLKILIVDDDDIVIYLHQIILEMSGLSANPYTAFNGKQALEIIATRDESQYLVLLDLNMPVMNGWEFLQEINNRMLSDKVSVIIVTSSTDSKDKERAKLYKNVIGFFEKPFDLDGCERIKSLHEISDYL